MTASLDPAFRALADALAGEYVLIDGTLRSRSIFDEDPPPPTTPRGGGDDMSWLAAVS